VLLLFLLKTHEHEHRKNNRIIIETNNQVAVTNISKFVHYPSVQTLLN